MGYFLHHLMAFSPQIRESKLVTRSLEALQSANAPDAGSVVNDLGLVAPLLSKRDVNSIHVSS